MANINISSLESINELNEQEVGSVIGGWGYYRYRKPKKSNYQKVDQAYAYIPQAAVNQNSANNGAGVSNGRNGSDGQDSNNDSTIYF